LLTLQAQAPQQAALAAAGLSVPLSHGPATAASALLHSSSMRHSMAGQQVQAAPVVVAPLGPHLWCHLAPGTAPLVPPKHQSAGAAFAQELLQRATQVQEQLGLLQDAWPAAMDQLVADGWQGQYVLPDK
jgi:phytoene dehydrogenase-like protein